jgi:hypothetical protein
VVAIAISSSFLKGLTERRYQLRDDELSAIIDHKIGEQGLRTISPNVTAANSHRL